MLDENLKILSKYRITWNKAGSDYFFPRTKRGLVFEGGDYSK